METAQTATQVTGSAGIVFTILVSILAQRALKHIWIFFAALQIIILFTLDSHYLPPASTTMFFTAMLDLINLKAVKDLFTETAESNPKATKATAITGIVIIGIPLLFAALVLKLVKCKQNSKITKFRNLLYYQGLIQYFKAVFITLLFDHLLIATSDDSQLSSKLVLLGITVVLLLFLRLLLVKSEGYLEQHRGMLGNIYPNLKTNRVDRLYGFFWFVQRICLVTTLVVVKPFFVQYALLQFWLMAKPLWFAYRMPYELLENGISDFANDILLILVHVCMATWITNHVPDDEERYAFGWRYSILIVTVFAINALFVFRSIMKRTVEKAIEKK